MTSKFYNISEENNEGIIDIFGDISWWDNDEHSFKEELDQVTSENITVRINSGGGDVFTGHTIYNMIKQTNKHVKVVVNGLAASIASVIAMAGDVIEMPANSMIMIHNPSTYQGGTSDDMRKTADTLDKVAETIKAVYIKRTGLSDEEITEMMNNETWMTAQEAKEKGFCDVITDEIKVDNSANAKFFNVYKNAPLIFTNKEDEGTNEQTEYDEIIKRLDGIESTLSDLLEQLTGNKQKEDEPEEEQKVSNGWSSFFNAKK